MPQIKKLKQWGLVKQDFKFLTFVDGLSQFLRTYLDGAQDILKSDIIQRVELFVETINTFTFINKHLEVDSMSGFYFVMDEINRPPLIPEQLSSGERHLLLQVYELLFVAPPKSLVLLDEPELSLHPNWQMTLIDNLDRALSNQVCQLLIATHSHMLVSDLPMKRSSVTQVEKDERDNLFANSISDCTYGWSAEEVLLKVFKTATDRNRYFGERIGKLLEKMGSNTITPKEVKAELNELQEISMHLSKIDPMKQILNTIAQYLASFVIYPYL